MFCRFVCTKAKANTNYNNEDVLNEDWRKMVQSKQRTNASNNVEQMSSKTVGHSNKSVENSNKNVELSNKNGDVIAANSIIAQPGNSKQRKQSAITTQISATI